MLDFTRAISEPALNYLSSETINGRIASPNDLAGLIKIGRGVFNYNSFYTGNFWAHGGDGMHSHSSLIAYNPDTKISVAINTNLKPYFIENDFQFHFDLLTILDGYF